MSPILTMDQVTLNFGGLAAVSDVNLTLNKGELVGLIGPNGAGKTTIFNLITGVYPPSRGTLTLSSGDKTVTLNGRLPHVICRAGVGRTFQNIRLFRDLTALENVKIALQHNVKYNLLTTFLHLPPWASREAHIETQSRELLEVVDLSEHADTVARNLPYGDQRHLEIARALATQPALLLLDEPAAGMNPNETAELTALISSLRTTYDLTILLIEHDMSLVMRICERIYVLDHGLVIANGTPNEVRHDPKVIEAYLGEEVDHA